MQRSQCIGDALARAYGAGHAAEGRRRLKNPAPIEQLVHLLDAVVSTYVK
jgi:hypothetical protein